MAEGSSKYIVINCGCSCGNYLVQLQYPEEYNQCCDINEIRELKSESELEKKLRELSLELFQLLRESKKIGASNLKVWPQIQSSQGHSLDSVTTTEATEEVTRTNDHDSKSPVSTRKESANKKGTSSMSKGKSAQLAVPGNWSNGHNKMLPVPETEQDSAWMSKLYNYFHPASPTSTPCISQKESNDSCNDEHFTEHLTNFQSCQCTDKGTELCTKCHEFLPYVEQHLKDANCKESDSVCALWKVCLSRRIYSVFEFAPEKMVLFSHNKDKIGTITEDYRGYRTKPDIGMGGFGRVFHHHTNTGSFKNIAVKEEKRKYSLIKDLQRFTSVKDLCHPNVLRFQEYVVGYQRDENEGLPLLLVMEHYEQRGLNEPFTKDKKCLWDYTSSAGDNTKYLFRNLLVISSDLFRALEYFTEKRLVHRDVKRSNILLKLMCNCTSAIECNCHGSDGRGGAIALLSDFDLVEKATSDEKLARLGDSEPSGTRGMKAPELFFVNENGKETFTSKADIWSAFLTIMHVLLGRDVNNDPLTKVTEFFQATTSGIQNSLQKIGSCIKVLEDYCGTCENKDIIITKKIQDLKKIQKAIEQLCRFQGGREKPKKMSKKKQARDNYCPAAEVLTAVHGASIMPQTCISKVPHVFQSTNQLQDSMRELWDIIQRGMCFRPEDRPEAKEVVGQLDTCLSKFLKNSSFN